jgi:hypothetical protein
MLTFDMINGLLELGGALFTMNNVRVLMRDRFVKGVSPLATIYFVVWGLWNCIWYPSLGQPFSFYGGISITVANFMWLAMLSWYWLQRKMTLGR